MAFEFSDGLAPVVVGRKFGYINGHGEIVVKPQYEEASSFSEGVAVVCNDYRWGYINKTGKEVIPLQFVEARNFSEGLAAVRIDSHSADAESNWGYINKQGDVVIAPRFYSALNFAEGVAHVSIGKFGEANPSGFIDKSGKFHRRQHLTNSKPLPQYSSLLTQQASFST